MVHVIVRWAQENDTANILQLIKNLAEFENKLEEVTLSEQELKRDLFSSDPYCKCLVAETNEQLVGMCLFNNAYSTWKGRKLYLEDLYIDKLHRRMGVGKAILLSLMEYAEANNVQVIHLACYKWNTPALEMYEHLNFRNITIEEEWHLIQVDRSIILKMSKEKKSMA